MKIATFNINSVQRRLPVLLAWLKRAKPDILCLQELKAAQTAFPVSEIEEAGYAMWGYGGNTCHPVTMVRPFATQYERNGGTIYLCMHPMISKHFAEPVRASEY